MSTKIEKGVSYSAKEEVDKYRALYYAGASGDYNPIHIDPEFGKMVGLGGVILQGLCTLGFVAKSVTDWAGDPGRLKRIKCRFAAPVLLGNTVNTTGEVVEMNGTRAKLALKVTNQDGVEVLKGVEAEVE
jgi:3-hydroxybutyryl-CoA dehydratase